jgi:predicted nucleic acid-binding protein
VARASEHTAVRDAIKKLSGRAATFVIAPQVLVEFWVVATRPVEVNGFGWAPSVVAVALTQVRQRFLLLQEGPELFEKWLSLVQTTHVRGKNAHDARLAALALVHGVPEILTLNVDHYKRFNGVMPLHPLDVK